MLTLIALATYFSLKGIGQMKAGTALDTASIAGAASGNAPQNGMLASPAPPQSADGFDAPASAFPSSDEDDDGEVMGRTAYATAAASGDSPEVGEIDLNETQATSGAETAVSQIWRKTTYEKKWNAYLNELWDECLDVDYICAQPGILYPYQAPAMTRQDNNPRFNNMPWARNISFESTDPTQYFETDAANPMVPSTDEEGDDE